MSPLLPSAPTTQPASIKLQSTINRSVPPPKILGRKAKSNHKGNSVRATNNYQTKVPKTKKRSGTVFVGHQNLRAFFRVQKSNQ